MPLHIVLMLYPYTIRNRAFNDTATPVCNLSLPKFDKGTPRSLNQNKCLHASFTSSFTFQRFFCGLCPSSLVIFSLRAQSDAYLFVPHVKEGASYKNTRLIVAVL